MAILVSPTERECLVILDSKGVSSSVPEQYGADFLIAAQREFWGVQRKEFPKDFFASLSDGRVAKEVGQMARLHHRAFFLEGEPQWTTEGFLMDADYSRWSRMQVRNLLRSLSLAHRIYVEWTKSPQDTVEALLEMEAWAKKPTHHSLLTRPKDTRDSWGRQDVREWACYMLQGFPLVGRARAEAIYDAFRRVPLRWDVSPGEMLKVPGIGQGVVRELYSSLAETTDRSKP